MHDRSFSRGFAVLAVVAALAWSAACGVGDPPTEAASDPPSATSEACAEGRTLRFAFYAFFDPVSYSADPDPGSAGFGDHLGYESDLLTALEAMEGAGLRFDRTPIAEWAGIWMRPAGPDFDIAGGGITILESRTADTEGNRVINFTSGHIEFRQSLLVRAEDAVRYPTHDHLTSDVRVGVLATTTGENRLLQLTGLTDSRGRLAAGTRIVTDSGTVTADGTDGYTITPSGASAALEGRRRVLPPSPDMPEVVYMGAATGERELLDAVRDGVIDAFARGEIGNQETARTYGDGGLFAVTALDTEVEEVGGWTLPLAEEALLACLNDKLDYLTDSRSIGYSQWRADPEVFLRRAQVWSP